MYMWLQQNQIEASLDWSMNTGFDKLRQEEPGSHLIYYVEGKFAPEANRAAELRDGQREGEKPWMTSYKFLDLVWSQILTLTFCYSSQ